MIVSLHKRNAQSVTDIVVDGHVDRGSDVGFAIMAAPESRGRLRIARSDWTASRTATQFKYGCGLTVDVVNSAPAPPLAACGPK